MGSHTTYEDIARGFLEHLQGKGQKLIVHNRKWMFEGAVLALHPEQLEHILRTYLLDSEIPQSHTTVSNVVKILHVMLEPHPLGKVDKKEGEQEKDEKDVEQPKKKDGPAHK
jgi:hypothetical protein